MEQAKAFSSPTGADPVAPAADRGMSQNMRWHGLFVFLLGTLIAALFAFVIYPRQAMVAPVIDLNGFGKIARNIVAGEGFSLGWGPTLRRAPVYPYYVAAFLWVFGHNGPDAVIYRPVIISHCFLFGLTCLTTWAVARKLFGNRVALVAGALCALMPQTLRYISMTEVETLMGLLIVLSVLTGLNLYREPSAKHGALFGLVCALSALTKAVAVILPVVFLLFCWLKWRKSRNSHPTASLLLPSVTVAGVFALCILPWIVRNHIVSGGRFRQISCNGPGEFIRGYVNVWPKYAFLKQNFGGNDPNADIWDWDANLYEDALLMRHGMSFFSTEKFGPNGERFPMEAKLELELKKEAIESAEMKRRILQEPGAFLNKFVIQIFTFWYIVDTVKKSLIVGAIAFLLIGLAIFGWIRARKQDIDPTPIVVVVLYYNIMYAAILAFARYSMPVYPALIALSAFGVAQFLPKRAQTEAQTPG
jgi:4-amino-4-deoxy-L-arabinose transferase-like glycosyltransferase